MSLPTATTEPALTKVEVDDLCFLVGRMIPADQDLSVPGADDPLIIADMVRSLGRERDAVRLLLGEVRRLRKAPKSDAGNSADIAAFVRHLRSLDASAFTALEAVVIRTYYRDDRVLRAIGMEPRPPFPQGYELETGDLSLLEPVTSRGAIWRRANGN